MGNYQCTKHTQGEWCREGEGRQRERAGEEGEEREEHRDPKPRPRPRPGHHGTKTPREGVKGKNEAGAAEGSVS